VKELKRRMYGNYQRYFAYNSVLQSADPSTRAQVFMSTALGSINYLLNMLPVRTDVMAEIDSTIKIAARAFMRLPGSAPTMLAMLESGFPSARELMIRARYQLLYALVLTPHTQAPAACLLRALMQQHLYHTIGTPVASWLHTTAVLLSREVSSGAALPPTTRRAQVSADSRVFGRQVARSALLEEARRHRLSTTITMSNQRPPPTTPSQHFWDLFFSGTTPASALGAFSLATKLSLRLPRAGGLGLSLVSVVLKSEYLTLLSRARLGPLALHLSPLAPTSWLLPERASPDQWRDACHGVVCPLCHRNMLADPFHVITECDFPPVAAARDRLRANVSTFVPILLSRISSAAEHFKCGALVEDLANRAARAFEETPPTSHNFLLFRLCLVLPWPAHCVSAGEHPFILLLAQLMDATTIPMDRLRSIYNIWVPWAAATTRAIMRVWATAVDSLTGWPPPGYWRLKLTSAALRDQAPRRIFLLPQQS